MSQAYPLAWPQGWPRTAAAARQKAQFRTELKPALANLKKQVEMMGGRGLVLSSNCTLGDERPTDPGVVAYFRWHGGGGGDPLDMAVPCDRWLSVAANVQAIALTLEAMRSMERWGAKHMIRAMFTGFRALPEKTGPSCWDVLGVDPDSFKGALLPTAEARILDAWKAKAKAAHPDAGGSHAAMTELNEAKDIALATVRGNRA